ncbi:hypothetical protein PG994_008315 [Apiospora phragmitis]|uniref:RRM domain-containing protein n=1 Tax=Apiospora phragmitis TaxID=2905665 RepID=A0ABR1USN9_9PEZI
MDQRALLEELREGSVPASPPQPGRPDLTPGWGRPTGGQPDRGNTTDTPSYEVAVRPEALAHENANLREHSRGFAPVLEGQGVIHFTSDRYEDSPSNLPGDSFQQGQVCLGRTHQMRPTQRAALPPPDFSDPTIAFYRTLQDEHPQRGTTPSRYRGAVRAEITHVAADDNCCLFLTGLPANITVRELIHQLQTCQVGKIAAIHINPPSGSHPRAAAKVTMWTRDGAARLYHAIESQQIRFEGHSLRAHWNCHRVGLQTLEDELRVILIIGRPEQLDRLVVTNFTTQIMFVEYSFGSYLNQAQNAYRLVRDTYDPDHILAVYRRDPCEPQTPLQVLEQ